MPKMHKRTPESQITLESVIERLLELLALLKEQIGKKDGKAEN